MEHLLNRNTLRGYELRQGIEAFAHRLVKVLALRPVQIKWMPCQTAAINSRGDMMLANVADDVVVNRALIVKFAGFVLHELLHRKYTKFSVRAGNQYLATLHNAVEDAWIENTCIKVGLVGNGEGLLGELIDTMTREALGAVSNWADPAQYPYALAVYLRKHATIKVPLAGGLEPIFAEADVRLNNARSSQDTLDIATWVLAQLKGLDQPTNPQPDDAGNEAGEDAGDKGNEAGDEAGDEAGEGAGGAGDGDEGAEGADGGGAGEAGEAIGKATAPTPATLATEVEPSVDPQGATGGSYFEQSALKGAGHHLAPAPCRAAPEISTPAKLRAEVRALFENTDTSGFDANRRTGSINTSALHKVGTGSDRVFKRRFESEGIDSAVVILLDVSGSMFWGTSPRIIAAIQTCDALVDSLTYAGVAVSVVTFGDNVAVAVPFGSPANRAKTIVRKIRDLDEGTSDSCSLRHAHGMLLARPEARRVCFVLTDGNGDRLGVKAQCASGEALGITTVGVGIGSDAQVQGVYTNAIKVTNMADLATTALKQIKVVV